MTIKYYKASVTCMMTIEVTSRWGAECTMEQIEKQAKDGAAGLLRWLKDPRAVTIGEGEVMSVERKHMTTAVKSLQPVKLIKVEVLPSE